MTWVNPQVSRHQERMICQLSGGTELRSPSLVLVAQNPEIRRSRQQRLCVCIRITLLGIVNKLFLAVVRVKRVGVHDGATITQMPQGDMAEFMGHMKHVLRVETRLTRDQNGMSPPKLHSNRSDSLGLRGKHSKM